MSYASDKLYNGYLRKNMPRIVSSVKPREIIVHLPCLTEHDREAIEAKNDFSGNFEAMKLLLSCMKRRENWPEQFIAALEECEHETIAAEIRAEYNKLRGINNSSPPPPASPAANVVTAHVHPAPSAPHLPDPGPAANALPAQPAQPTRDVPSEACGTNPIQETESHTQSTPVQPAAPVVEVTTPPEPPQVQAEPQTQAVVAPPSSPKLAHATPNPSPLPERVDFIPHNEPEENQEPDIVQVQDVPHEAVNIPQEAEENTEVPPAVESKEETCENDDSMETTTLVDQPTEAPAIALDDNTAAIDIVHKPIAFEPEPVPVVMEVSAQSTTTVEEDSLTSPIVDSPIAPPVSPARSKPPMTNLDDLILTPEKAPVQETSPREEKAPDVVPVLEETPEPEKAQVAEIVQETEVTPSQPAEVENGESVSEEEDICFSKPGVLMSVEPQNNTTRRSSSPDPAPYSGDSGRLEMSEVETSTPSCLENGISHKQPGNDVSESPAPSLEEDDIKENVGHVAEEPPISNKEIQASLTEVSGEPIKEAMTTVPTTVPIVPENSLISDQSCCAIAEDMSESPAHSVEEEDVEENVKHVEEEPPILIKEIQASHTEVSGEPIKEVTTTVPLVPETTLISDQSCCAVAEDMSESLALSLEEEDVEENVGHVAEEPSILNKEIETPLTEDSREPIKEATTTVPLVPETDQSCSCPNAGDMSPASSLDVEEVEENLTHVVEQPPISNQENQTPLIEENEEQAIELTIPATTVISDTSCYPNEQGISESPAPSLDVEDVRENVGHVAEEPSILNLEVQTQLQQINGEPANEITTATEISAIASITNVEREADRNLTQEVQTPVIQVNGEPAKEIAPVPSKPAPATNDSHQPNDPLVDQKLPNSGNPTADRLNTRYILTAAGVGACALLIAWRFKH